MKEDDKWPEARPLSRTGPIEAAHAEGQTAAFGAKVPENTWHLATGDDPHGPTFGREAPNQREPVIRTTLLPETKGWAGKSQIRTFICGIKHLDL